MIAGYLRWVDVDPSARPPLDLARTAQLLRPLVAAAAKLRGPGFREALVCALHRELLIAFGPWVAGWTWSASEPGGGGPVHGWCCADHSLFPVAEDPAGGPRADLADRDDDPVTASTARVIAALEDWQRCLEELAALFDEIHGKHKLPPPGGTRSQIERGVEVAASRVLPWVIARTHAEDAWYSTFTKLLAWYVESAGYDLELARDVIAETIDGKFLSWMEPDAPVATATCGEIGRAIAGMAQSTDERDATAAWRLARPRAFANLEKVVHVPVRADGHRRYIEERDRDRDPDRAERMLAALELCRDSARRGMSLTFDQMCEWQAAVLGEKQVGFRTGKAFAKGGREVYPFTPSTQANFEEALNDSAGTVAIHAARVYLDVCFYHPFPDGNARAARLALDHVLTRNGYALHVAEPVFIVSRTIVDRSVGWSFARVLDRLIGPLDRT